MILETKGDKVLRRCDTCGNEKWVEKWKYYKLEEHTCRDCYCRLKAAARKGKPSRYKGIIRQPNPKRGSTYINSSGYVEEYIGAVDNNRKGKYYLQHRLIVEKYLGRVLDKSELVHHINGDKTDNRLENLYLCQSMSHHKTLHQQLEQVSMQLVKLNLIEFDNEAGSYRIAAHISNDMVNNPVNSGEPLTYNDEGNPDPSFEE
jgi:hypothetical protein